jgi:hypothetical protein
MSRACTNKSTPPSEDWTFWLVCRARESRWCAILICPQLRRSKLAEDGRQPRRDSCRGPLLRQLQGCLRPDQWNALDSASRLRFLASMNINPHRRGVFNHLFRLGYFIRGAVRNQKELVRLQRYLISEDAALGNTDAV